VAVIGVLWLAVAQPLAAGRIIRTLRRLFSRTPAPT
jgi:hypothetical protein